MTNIVMFPTSVLMDAYAQLRLAGQDPSLKLVRSSAGQMHVEVAGGNDTLFVPGIHAVSDISSTTELPLKWLYIVMRQGCDFMVLREHQGRISLDVTSDLAFLQSNAPSTTLEQPPATRTTVAVNANAQGVLLH
jgi:hypothetical protein